MNQAAVSYDEVAAVAYHLWESDGRPHGRAMKHWFEAESLLSLGRAQVQDSPTSSPVPETASARKIPYGLVLRDATLR